jgi:hypothetical protein
LGPEWGVGPPGRMGRGLGLTSELGKNGSALGRPLERGGRADPKEVGVGRGLLLIEAMTL